MDTFNALESELRPVLLRFAAAEREAARMSPGFDMAEPVERMPAAGLNSAFEIDATSSLAVPFAGGLEGDPEIRIAGGRGKIVELLLQLLLKSPAQPKSPKLPAPKRPGPERPAPVAPRRPDRTIDRMPDLGGDPESGLLKPGVGEPEIVLPDVSTVANPDNMLLEEEFEQMPGTGLVDPNRIRTAQAYADDVFRFENGHAKQRRMVDMVAGLGAESIHPEDIPPVDLVVVDGKVWTLDHRRLVAARLAGKLVRYRKRLSRGGLKVFQRKLSTRTDGLSIRIRKDQEK